MKRWILGATLGLAFAAALAAPAMAQRAKVTIYTSLENDQLGPFKQAIEAAVPEAEVVWVRDSTGVITARFLAEKDNPRADMVLGHQAYCIKHRRFGRNRAQRAGLLFEQVPYRQHGIPLRVRAHPSASTASGATASGRAR